MTDPAGGVSPTAPDDLDCPACGYDPMAPHNGRGSCPTAPDEAGLAQALFRTLYNAGVAFNSGDLIPRLTATVRAAGYRYMADGITPSECEAVDAILDAERLRQIAEWLWMDHSQEETAKRVNLIADRHERFAAGFRRSREATTEAQPELVDKRDPECVKAWPGCHSFGYDPACCRFPKSCSAGDWEPVEAVEASRSPKPTERSKP